MTSYLLKDYFIHEIMIFSTESTQPEPSFRLTGSEFKSVVEGLASDEQNLTRFEHLLDFEKDFAAGNDLPLLQRAEKAVYHYQYLPDSSIEKLLSALYEIGLTIPAENMTSLDYEVSYLRTSVLVMMDFHHDIIVQNNGKEKT